MSTSEQLISHSPGLFLLPKTGSMRVPGLVVATEQLLEEALDAQAIEQVRNVAHLPGIVGHSIAMPDIHWGYGFPIGGVAATDLTTGVVSPGGVGYDINCGVRLATIPLLFSTLSQGKKETLLQRIFQKVPSGVGRGHKKKPLLLSAHDYRQIAQKGAKWSVEQGRGVEKDLLHIESGGFLQGGDLDAVSSHALERGKGQLGTIGSGNHFVEIGEIKQVIDREIADAWNLNEGETYLLIHSGSRGFGHQVCQDTLDAYAAAGLGKDLPDRQLICSPIKSKAGQRYLSSMAVAANFAFCNRQHILHSIREVFQEVLQVPPDQVRLLYDVCHNIAKIEEHQGRSLLVHRKGATRAFGPQSPELPPTFQKTGQPVIVPGDMGRASYVMSGLGNPLTYCSSCHGAGRMRSRIQSKKMWRGENFFQYLNQCGVEVVATSKRTIVEEMPDAYKDVDLVVSAVELAGLAKKVVRLRPRLVVKG